MEEEEERDIVDQFGWFMKIQPTSDEVSGQQDVRLTIKWTEPFSYESTLLKTISSLAGELRDTTNSPEIADLAAAVLVKLNRFCYTTQPTGTKTIQPRT